MIAINILIPVWWVDAELMDYIEHVPYLSGFNCTKTCMGYVCMCVCVCRERVQFSSVQSISRIQLFVTPWTVAYQALPFMGFSSKNTGVGCHFLLQETFMTQGLNPDLPHCRQTLYHLSHQGYSPGAKLWSGCECWSSEQQRGDTPCPRSGARLHFPGPAVWRYSMSKNRKIPVRW